VVKAGLGILIANCAICEQFEQEDFKQSFLVAVLDPSYKVLWW